MLAGLLGNIGLKSDDEDWYLGARGIRFWRHPGAHLSKKPGRWIVAAELVETTRLYGRGIAAIDPQWIPALAGHLLKKQLLEPHWEKKAARGDRARARDAVRHRHLPEPARELRPRRPGGGARDLHPRGARRGRVGDASCRSSRTTSKLIAQVEELEHKSRRQDVLVDDELIYAFYDQQVPADVISGARFERWYRDEVRRQQPKLLMLTRDELMRHEAAGITTASFPKTIRLGGVDCAAHYLHEPGDARTASPSPCRSTR